MLSRNILLLPHCLPDSEIFVLLALQLKYFNNTKYCAKVHKLTYQFLKMRPENNNISVQITEIISEGKNNNYSSKYHWLITILVVLVGNHYCYSLQILIYLII